VARREGLKACVPGLALFAVLGGAYFAARWSYFGAPLPNTFYAKSAFTLRHAERGLAYVAGFLANPFAWCALPLWVAGAVNAWRQAGARVLVAAPALAVAVVVAEGGDGLPMYRFMVPVVPLLAVLAAFGIDWLARLESPRRRLATGAGLALLAASVALSFFPARDEQYQLYVAQRDYELPAWTAAGKALAKAFPPQATLAAVPIGAVSFYSGLKVIDLVGLTDAEIARAPATDLGSGWAGHEKHDGPSVLRRRPELLLLGNVCVDRVAHHDGVPPCLDVPAIRARELDLREDPRFSEEYELRDLAVDELHWLHYYGRKEH
jgi:hypothetical protein